MLRGPADNPLFLSKDMTNNHKQNPHSHDARGDKAHHDLQVSRPAELPRQPLAGPDVNLSIHPAPIIQSSLTLLNSEAPPVPG